MMSEDKKKYKIYWFIGAILSFFTYFSGLILIYNAVRKKLISRSRAVILTYHRIRDDAEDSEISVKIKNFENQIQHLKKNFDIIPLQELIRCIENRFPITNDSAVITFDDGYKDNYQNAYPVLKKNNLPGTIFLISSLIGKNSDMLSLDEINEMNKHNISFGSHTVTHRILSEIDTDLAKSEIKKSKESLQNLLKQKIEFFAYPVGKKRHFNEAAKAAIKRCGYKAALTTINGSADASRDLFEIKRVGIRNCPLFVFKVRVSGLFESGPVFFIRKLFNLI